MDYNIFGYDFEVFKYDWLVVFVNKNTSEKTVIINDKQALKDFYAKYKDSIFVGYNSLGYDVY